MLDPVELFPRQRRTPLPGGYMGKILRVNLSTGRLTNENLPEEPVLRKAFRRKDMIAFFEALPPTVIGIEACGASHHRVAATLHRSISASSRSAKVLHRAESHRNTRCRCRR